jgi:putative ABC transport system permease protein
MKIGEVISIAIGSLRSNKLRAILTILGVVVGIFSIIVIMTIITMLQNSIDSGFSQLNKNTFQIQKYPAMMGHGPGMRDRFRNRPDLTLDEFYRLKDLLTNAQYIGAEQWNFGKQVTFGNKETNPNISVAGVTTGAMRTNNWNVEYGRDFRQTDIDFAKNVCILGRDVVEKLFTNINPVGQTIRVDGNPLQVIGVLEQQPSLFGMARDSYIMMPISTYQQKYGKYNNSINITVMSYSKVDYNNVIDAATGYMRKIRKVGHGEEDNFYIFSNESLISQVNDITSGIKIGALAVSIIALIAAGVGIMNIMLVSVTERTREIGIRKAIGARKKSILIQFLLEAITLCIIGGFIGIVLGVGIGNIAGSFLNAKAAVPYDWVIIGLSLCIFVGVLFGTYPAYKAANLDPIEALRYE